MKLSTRYALLVTVVYLAAVGFVWWLLTNRLTAAGNTVSALSAQIADQSQGMRDLKTKLSAVAAGQAAGEIADRTAEALSAFIKDRVAKLASARYLGSFTGGAEEQKGAAARALAAAPVLDQIVVTDGSGVAVAVAPESAGLLGRPYLPASEVAARRRSKAVNVTMRVSEKTPARLLVFTAGLRLQVGPRAVFMGVVAEAAALENILKGVAGAVPGETEKRFALLDDKGVIVLAPTPDLLGRTAVETAEFKPLADAAEGSLVEISHDLRRWVAVRRPGPQGMTVVGLASIGPPPTAGTAGSAQIPGPPFVILGVAAAAGLAGLLLVVLMPLGRLGGLAKSAEALATGSSSVEFKSSGANDEIGAASRAMEKVGEQLSAERTHREEAASAYATVQRDLQRVQAENRELQEYQRNLETKGRQQQAALEGEVAAARQELESLRTELESLRNELTLQQTAVATRDAAVAARDTAIAERDAALVQAGQQIQSLTESLAALQQSVESLSGRLVEANAELDRRRAAPAAAFGLFSEASEALSVELAGLVELVQGYIGQLIEAGAITEEQQQFLSTVITRSARSQRLMTDLRDFSNIVRPDGLVREPLDMGAMLTDVVGSAMEDAEARGISLDTDIPSLPEALGDESRLRQLFTILLQNAIRFTPEGGTVSVRVAVREGVAGVRIEDGAESIPVKSEEVFNHFHAPDEEILELRGSGLRFPILRAIAGAHGGSIDLAITDQGTNLFFVRIPVRSEAPTADQTAALFAGVSSGDARPAAAAPAPAEAAGIGVSGGAEAPAAGAEAPAAPSPETDAFAQAFAAFAAHASPAPAAGEAPAEPAAPSAEADSFAQEFAAFAASPAAAPPAPSELAAAPADLSAAPAEFSAAPEVPAEPSAEVDAFAQEFAAFSAVPPAPAPAGTAGMGVPAEGEAPAAPGAPPADAGGAEAPAAGGPSPFGDIPAPEGVETTESIMAAPADAPAPDAPPAIGLDDLWTVPDPGAPPTVESIEAAPEAPPAAPDAGEAKADDQQKPSEFGTDDILTE